MFTAKLQKKKNLMNYLLILEFLSFENKSYHIVNLTNA